MAGPAGGQQLLLVLDDAASSEQVRPLLPGAGGSLVLVTSRRHLSALEDATAISLDTLPPGEAAALLVRLAGRAGLSPDDPAVAEITRLCGYLPLAIGMVARQLHHHPAWTAAGRAAELAAARDRLELMATENLSVAAAFDLSYADLTEDQQRLFRRLGLHPGADVDAYAAAALDGTDLAAARRGLEALYDQYLLTEPAAGPVPAARPDPRARPRPGRAALTRTVTGMRPPPGCWITTSTPPPAPTPSSPARPAPARPPRTARYRPRFPPWPTGSRRWPGPAPSAPACSPAWTTPPRPASTPGSSLSPPASPGCCGATAPGPTPSPGTRPRSRPRGISVTGSARPTPSTTWGTCGG